MGLKVNDVDVFDPINDENRKRLIECFVKFYGEKRRELITEKINSITFVFIPCQIDIFGQSTSRVIKNICKESNISSDELIAAYEKFDQLFEHIDQTLEKQQKTELNQVFSDCPRVLSARGLLSKLESFSQEEIDSFPEQKKESYYYCLKQSRKCVEDISSEIYMYDVKRVAEISDFENAGVDDKKRIVTMLNSLGYKYSEMHEVLEDGSVLEKINQVKDIGKKYKNKDKLDKFNSTIYSGVIKKIHDMKSIDGDLSYIQRAYDMAFDQSSASAMQYTVVDVNKQPRSLIMFSGNGLTVSMSTIIHEVNHAVESNLTVFDDKRVCEKSGFDIIEYDIEPEQNYDGQNIRLGIPEVGKDSGQRKYELLNEVFNELITQDIMREVTKDNFSITLNRSSKSGADYKFGFRLLKEFYMQNKEAIIESRLSQDPKAMANLIGEDELNKIADLVDDFMYPNANKDSEREREAIKYINQVGTNLYNKTHQQEAVPSA